MNFNQLILKVAKTLPQDEKIALQQAVAIQENEGYLGNKEEAYDILGEIF